MRKAKTDGIERNHCQQRHWFGRFKRRSIIVSKSKAMVDLTMALFARFRVNGDVANRVKISVTSMAGYSDLLQRRERLAAAQDRMLDDHQWWALVRWPEPWPHITVSGHICLIIMGEAAHVQTAVTGKLTLKTIGVLGGLGPQATIDFETRIHQVAQRLTSPHGNLGYPPMLVYYYRHPPMIVNADFTPRFPLQPDPRRLEAARHVGTLVDFLVITANSPHRFQEQMEQAAGRTVLSMIAVT